MMQILDHPEMHGVTVDWDARGYATCFYLPKAITMTLISGYNIKMRHAIVDRWQELEEQIAQPNPMAILSDPTALRLVLLEHLNKADHSRGITNKHWVQKKSLGAWEAVCITDSAKNRDRQPSDNKSRHLFWKGAPRHNQRMPGWFFYAQNLEFTSCHTKIPTTKIWPPCPI